jgi:serine protease AprX
VHNDLPLRWEFAARVAELADARDLGSRGETLEGSSPSPRTPPSPGMPETDQQVPSHMRRLLFIFLLLRASPLLAAGPVDERAFAGKAAGERASVLVVLRGQADLSAAHGIADPAQRRRFVFEALQAQAEVSQGALRERLERAGVRYRAFYLVNMLELEADRALAEELAAREDVSSVAANRQAAFVSAPVVAEGRAAAAAGVEQNVVKIRAPEVWARGFTGQGLVVGSADTGVTWDHPALKSHYRGWNGTTATASHDYNWHDSIHDARAGNPCGSDSRVPCDDESLRTAHGTATTSLMVGDDGAGNQVGVAPGARFIGCRNMDEGDGTPARYTECFEWFLAPTDPNGQNPRPELGAHVINNSWGCPESEGCTEPDILQAVVENVRAAGVFVAVAASNGGPACATLDVPAYYEASFTVGATSIDDTIAGFSSRGPVTADGSNRLKPDICAPGVALRVAAPPSGYRSDFSGTSGATPMVAGAVALLWSAVPALQGHPVETADLLRRTAVALTSLGEDCGGYPGAAVPNAVFGWGRIDIEAAVEAAASAVVRPHVAASSRHHGTPRALPPRS